MAEPQKIKIRVCQGTACFVMGASELMEAFENMPKEWNDVLDVAAVPCLNFCNDRSEIGSMPYVTVNDVPYAGMTSVKLRAMIKQLVDEAKNPVVVRKAD